MPERTHLRCGRTCGCTDADADTCPARDTKAEESADLDHSYPEDRRWGLC